MAQLIDKSPAELGYISGVKCTQCHTVTSLKDLRDQYGTIFVTGCDRMDGGEFVPVLDIERVGKILDPRKAGRSILGKRYLESPSYLGLLPELLPFVLQNGHPKTYVADFPLTDLRRSSAIGPELGIELYFLDDGVNPTGSFKDRAIAMSVNTAQELGYNRMIVASTGNLVLSSLYFGSRAGMYVHALLPEALTDAKKAKVAELVGTIQANGGNVEVSYHNATYDHLNHVTAGDIVDKLNSQDGLKTAFTPNREPRTWYGMGEWTAAFQLVAQLYYQHEAKEGKPINMYIVGGSGKLACMVTEASKVLQDLCILRNPMRVWSVQPNLNQPIVEGYNGQVLPALLNGKALDDIRHQIKPVYGKNPQDTIVEEVAIGQPGSFLHTLLSLAEPNSVNFPEWRNIRGGAIAIPDSETLDGLIEIASKEGITPQFGGATAFMGLKRAIEENPALRDEIHVVYISGNGKGKLRGTLEKLAKGGRFGREEELLGIAQRF